MARVSDCNCQTYKMNTMMNFSQRSRCWKIFWLLSIFTCIYFVFDYSDRGHRVTRFIFYANDLIYKNILLNASLVNDYENSNNSLIEMTKFSKAYFKEYEGFLNNTLKHKKHPLKFFPLEPILKLKKFPKYIRREAEFNYTKKDNMKKILYWNDSYGSKFFGLGYGQAPFKLGQCEYQNCFATSDRTRFSTSEVDAIMWHFRSNDRSLPNPRYPKAKYIFFMAESASYLFGNIKKYNNIFDYTFTYRSDSDFPFPYSYLSTRRVPDKSYLTGDYTKKKTKIAAWFISNCGGVSGRMNVKSELQKYIPLDIYGRCGKLSCPRETGSQCYEMITEQYFFYLSFENSLCDDYITEKFFIILNYDIVPVAYGSGPYWKHAPPHSYIDAFDFHSLKELADYMIYLSKNPSEYNEYFRWKTYYFTIPGPMIRFSYVCKICELLNTGNQAKNNTSRYDLVKWFVKGSNCMAGGSTPVIKKFISGENQILTVNEYRKKMNLL